MATVSAQPNDPIVARRWDFGDGSSDGSRRAVSHLRAARRLSGARCSRPRASGLPLYGRVIVVVRAPAAWSAPSLLATGVAGGRVAADAGDRDRASSRACDPTTKVLGAAVQWPDLVDASPTVTPTATRHHGDLEPRVSAIPASTTSRCSCSSTGRRRRSVRPCTLTVGNIDGSAPSPVVLVAPSADATVGEAYAPNPGATDGAHAPRRRRRAVRLRRGVAVARATSPSTATARSAGRRRGAQRGPQRVAVRIVDANGVSAGADVGGRRGRRSRAAARSPARAPSPRGRLAAALLVLALRDAPPSLRRDGEAVAEAGHEELGAAGERARIADAPPT